MERNVMIFGAVIIAAAILIVNHWTINTTADGLVATRLNRWTGEIEVCAFNPKPLLGSDIYGRKLVCDR